MMPVAHSVGGTPAFFHKGLLEKPMTEDSLTLGRNSVYSCSAKGAEQRGYLPPLANSVLNTSAGDLQSTSQGHAGQAVFVAAISDSYHA
jgi:hypothetical protein